MPPLIPRTIYTHSCYFCCILCRLTFLCSAMGTCASNTTDANRFLNIALLTALKCMPPWDDVPCLPLDLTCATPATCCRMPFCAPRLPGRTHLPVQRLHYSAGLPRWRRPHSAIGSACLGRDASCTADGAATDKHSRPAEHRDLLALLGLAACAALRANIDAIYDYTMVSGTLDAVEQTVSLYMHTAVPYWVD